MPLISIIIPVYNVETYLRRCLDSILDQNFRDFEVILIDDGSTDKSGIICNEYATKDERVKVFHKENGGVSSARNVGLKIAKGEWINFFDSDDEINSDEWQNSINRLSDNIDFLWCGYIQYHSDGNEYTINDDIEENLSAKNAIKSLFVPKYYRYQGYLWNKFYNREIIQRYSLKFDEKITFNEDRLFNFHYLLCCNKFGLFANIRYYKYFERSNGAMMSLSTKKYQSFITDLVSMNEMYGIARRHAKIKELEPIIQNAVTLSYRRNRQLMYNQKVFDISHWLKCIMAYLRNGITLVKIKVIIHEEMDLLKASKY